MFLKADLDGLVDPEGWAGLGWAGPGGTGTSRWPLATLFYGEYKNTYGRRGGDGEEGEVAGVSRAEGGQRGGPFHGMERFIQGKPWIADAGVPFWPELIKYPLYTMNVVKEIG